MMSRKIFAAIATAMLLSLPGFVQAAQPSSPEDSLAAWLFGFEDGMAGQFNDGAWAFVKNGNGIYLMSSQQNDGSNRYQVEYHVSQSSDCVFALNVTLRSEDVERHRSSIIRANDIALVKYADSIDPQKDTHFYEETIKGAPGVFNPDSITFGHGIMSVDSIEQLTGAYADFRTRFCHGRP